MNTPRPGRTVGVGVGVGVDGSESARRAVRWAGSRGRGGAAGLLLGSVGHAVLQRAHRPVAVVRPEPAAAG